MESNTSTQPINSQDPSVQSSISNNNQKSILPTILGVLLLIIAVGFGGYYLGTQQKLPTVGKETETALPSLIVTSVPTVTPIATDSNETTSWQTYTNQVDGISIKYPSTYFVTNSESEDYYDIFFTNSLAEKEELEECFNSSGIECNTYSLGLQFEKKTKASSKTLQDYIKEETEEDLNTYTSMTIGGYPALQNQFEGIGIVNNTYIDTGNTVIHIFANAIKEAEKNIEIYNQMLTTITFN